MRPALGLKLFKTRSDPHLLSLTRSSRVVKVAAVQLDVVDKDKARTLEKVCRWLDTAGKKEVDVAVLPELVLSASYCGIGTSKTLLDKLAEPVPGASTDAVAKKAKEYGMHVTAGIAQRKGRKVYNSVVLIDDSGEVAGTYSKSHPFTPTEFTFEPGNELPVFKTRFGTVGMLICFDLEFPETARVLRLKGAEFILHSVANWEAGGVPIGQDVEHLFDSLFAARALENRVPVVSADRVGWDPELKSRMVGQSRIFGVTGETLAKAGPREQMITATIDLDRARQVRSAKWGTKDWVYADQLEYRRPDLYGRICERAREKKTRR
jgi:predicted amidohydrolase